MFRLEKGPNPAKIEYRNNGAHLLCKLNFINVTQKRQFSFYLVDLIGFDNVRICILKNLFLSFLFIRLFLGSYNKMYFNSYEFHRKEKIHSLK